MDKGECVVCIVCVFLCAVGAGWDPPPCLWCVWLLAAFYVGCKRTVGVCGRRAFQRYETTHSMLLSTKSSDDHWRVVKEVLLFLRLVGRRLVRLRA